MEMPTVEMSNVNPADENVQNNGEEYDDTVFDNNQPLDEADSSTQGETFQELQ